MNGLDRCFFDQRESQQHGDDCGYSYISLGRLHPYGSGSGSSSGSGRRRTRRGLSDSPTAPTTPTSASDNASDATLTDSELPLARDSTLLVQNGMLRSTFDRPDHERCLLEGARPPPDVPPRNPTMSRLNGRITGNPADLGDFEPSCLVRTPSGNFYVPSGDIQKNPSMDYKSNSSCSSPGKQDKGTLERMDRSDRHPAFGAPVPVLPVRNNLRATHFPPAASRFHFRKGLSSRCSWKCTAIVFIVLFVLLLSIASYMSASYFTDNWSYQNAKPCSVLVGDTADKFSSSKATTLESTNKSVTRPHPSSTSASGKRELKSRPRRSVDGHASSPSISSTDSSSVDMHELITLPSSTTVSLMHGVSEVSINQETEVTEGAFNAYVSSSVSDNGSTGNITSSNTTLNKMGGSTQTYNSTSLSTGQKNKLNALTISTKPINTKKEDTDPLEIESNTKNNIAYDPKDMQGDAFPSILSYGLQKLQYTKLLTRLNEVSEELHIFSNEYSEPERNLKQLHYDNDRDSSSETIMTTKFDFNKYQTSNLVPEVTAKPIIESVFTTHNAFSKNEHVVPITTLSPSVTNSPNVVSTKTAATTEKETTINNELPFATESKTSETVSNAKHVLINLTISADDANNDSYKPLYSLTVTVPTVGDSNEIPTVKITPLDTEPTMPTNFNKPISIQNTTKTTKTIETEDWGGSCECSCPVCDSGHSSDDLYDDYVDKTTLFNENTEDLSSPYSTDGSTITEENIKTTNDASSEFTTQRELNYISTTDSVTDSDLASKDIIPDIYLSTTDSTIASSTESELISTTDFPKCVCPKIKPPPILILEGARTFPAQSFPPDGTTFKQITLGEKLSKEIPPYSYWNMQFYQSEAAYVKFDYMIPRGASIGVYARRNALPTHTQYHFLEVLSGFKARTTRASHPSVKKEITHYMEQGHWFLSLYNDDGDPQEISFIAMVADDMTQNCPNGCSGKGECLMGHCQCQPGFGGDDCSESVCPVLCSQRGEYINGECQCNPGWKGKECSLRHDECEVPDCNGHGHCVNGKCSCVRGYKGKFCEDVDCPHPTCSGHGFCIEGVCVCKKGWKGLDCATMDKDALQCLPDCSGHGTFDVDTQTCTCHARWSGDDCSKEVCDLDCGPHGRCVGEACVCDQGWTGEYCTSKLCDTRCSDHGQCKNGTCLCVSGWNGRHCTLEGCPRGCAGHGQCRVANDGHWECKCFDGWDGPDCTTLKEQLCDDSKDNDKDGLIDCEDPECCQSSACKGSQLCVSSPKPTDILLRKQPPAITASFFERMKFLIDEGSLQNYAKQETFNESMFWNHFNTSRSAVIRGRVVTSLGSGLVGVRVSTSTPLEGFTLTREDGWFDLLVNGGGAVTLHFGRAPFKRSTQVIFVPWNEVVIIDEVVMTTADEKGNMGPPQACLAHDYDAMKPVVLATWKHGFQGACPDKSAILAESQVVQESLQIPGTGLNLVYHSSRAAGYLSTIQLQLTPEKVPPTLALIHLRITIEGILFEKVFEADPVIKFTYPWNRLNVYRQRVYGVTTALVKVGYQYTDCKDIIWNVQTTKLSGHDMSISDVGGWNLDIHHRYNFHEGILQKGDGTNIYLKHKPRLIITAMGDGRQRALECGNECMGAARRQRLLAPVALATAPDGSLFVGDFNLVRKIGTDGSVRTVVKLNATRVSYRYHMALSPLDGTLYISDPESHQIIKVRNTEDFTDPERNWETVVGSGERCLPGDEAHCGDGALARDAKLAYPKGVAVSIDNVLYFADGTNIRMVDRDGIITTVIGNHMHRAHWKPIPCEGTLSVEEVHLRWPTELSINPLDNSLHIIDDHMILQMAPDGRVKVIAGRPLHCPSPLTGYDMELATYATLVMPQSIAFGAAGDLYVAESDSQRINRVRLITTDGKISLYAGAESKCNCLERGCDCFEADHFLASNSKFNTISAVTVSPDGIVHIADQANYRIRSVMASIPDASGSREYEIYSPDTQETYIFNRFGQHVMTKNILTGENNYIFTYTVNTSNGKLSTVTDAAGNKVFLLRDYSSLVNSIENTKGQKCRLKMSRMKMLQELRTPDNFNVTFDYHGTSGLLKAKYDSTGRSYIYKYDEFGRLTSAVTPTGRIINLTFDLSLKGATVLVSENNRKPISILIKGSSVNTRVGEAEKKTVISSDNSISSSLPWGHIISTDTVPYTILSEIDPILGESYPVPAKQRTEVGGDLANRFEWRYFLRRLQSNKGKSSKAVAQIGRKLRVNGENLLTLEYDRDTSTVAVFMDDKVELLNVTYDRMARPVKWGPRSGIFAEVELDYDRFNRLTSWKWGDLNETYGYDRAGRLHEIRYGDGSSLAYSFRDMFTNLPLKVTTPRGSDYLLDYDDSGALQNLTTPRGHIHTFALMTSLGYFKYQYFSPMNRHPYEILYNDDGHILAKIFPHQSGKILYVYDSTGKLETVLAGASAIRYVYHENTHLVKNVEISDPDYELRQDYKYHAGILKDEKMKFNSKTGLNNAHFKYQYDGNARLSTIDMNINSKEMPQLRLKYNQNLGSLEGVSDLRIYSNTFNRSVMQDTSKQYFTITDYDDHGRIKTVLMNIKSFDVFRLELEYDVRNRIKSKKMMIGDTSSSERVSYNYDGHLMEVVGSIDDWKYVYDENGNIISIIEHGEKRYLGYDIGDRVVQYGDIEFSSYDGRGFVIRRGEQKYRYNSRGQFVHAFERDKFQMWYFYDDRNRLVAWKDDKNNITQFFYTNPQTPNLITHMHYPKSEKTVRFLYDQRNFLTCVETEDQRFYVATDHNGSPLVVFDVNGEIIKEIKRSPFGKIVKDTNPGFYLPVDFQSGIFDYNTNLIYLENRLYDPVVGQWMTPSWEHLATKLSLPTDIFIYRFRNNDPINRNQNVPYMTSLASWLQLYGYDLNKMMGAKYITDMIFQPKTSVTAPQLVPDFGVLSGLQCIIEKVNDKLSDIEFVPTPLLKMEPMTRNLLPRVSYKRGVFGEGVLISRVDGKAFISVADGANSVVEDVITTVFNNSYFLDVHFSIHDQDVFYFVKDNSLKIRDDMEELRRLSGKFNVSQDETNDQGLEVRVHAVGKGSAQAVIVLRYGVDPSQERIKLLKHAHKRAAARAWEREKALVAAGWEGRGSWTEEEKEELISHGIVDGWAAKDVHSVSRYPQLADDPANIVFVRDGRRKRRKSGRARHRL
nr:teneurin-m isoform X1 [Danaus plexippus plexippus]